MIMNPMNNKAITPEILVPRLGDYLVESKLITLDQLLDALQYQKDLKQTRQPDDIPLVGQILVQLGFIEQQTLDAAITELIIKLKNALQKSNVELEQRVKERTRELELALNKIYELNSLKSEFVSNISHELRTPLTHIMGYANLMFDGTLGSINQDQREALDAINIACNRLEQLIGDLISFTDIENGKMLIQPIAISPASLCNETYQKSRKTAAEQSIKLYVQCPPNLPDVLADKDKILWVLTQFTNNALKFTSQNGYVLIKAALAEPYVEFCVRDTGIGIPKEKLQEIFEPFHQLDGSTTRQAGGTGIGLTIAKEIVEAHNSEITVNSKVKKGSEFKFKLHIV